MAPKIIIRTDEITIFAGSACIFVSQRFDTCFLLISYDTCQRYKLSKLFDYSYKIGTIPLG